MYRVDKKKLKQSLDFYDQVMSEFEADTFTESSSRVELYALERIVTILIDVQLDVSQLVIDAFMMRDAASYTDLIAVLYEEEVFTSYAYEVYYDFIGLRAGLTKGYETDSVEDLVTFMTNHYLTLQAFTKTIRAYIAKEADLVLNNLQ